MVFSSVALPACQMELIICNVFPNLTAVLPDSHLFWMCLPRLVTLFTDPHKHKKGVPPYINKKKTKKESLDFATTV